MMTPLKAFLIAVAIGAAIPIGFFAKQRYDSRAADQAYRTDAPKYRQLTPRIYVAAQIGPNDLASYRRHTPVASVIDLRPDGEAADQPSSADMAAEAKKQQLEFAYIPTPHGPVPEAVVQQFAQEMEKGRKPVLLYCRSGARAARVWALAEASRPGGLDAEAIVATVRGAGLTVEAEKADIARRIAMRAPK